MTDREAAIGLKEFEYGRKSVEKEAIKTLVDSLSCSISQARLARDEGFAEFSPTSLVALRRQSPVDSHSASNTRREHDARGWQYEQRLESLLSKMAKK